MIVQHWDWPEIRKDLRLNSYDRDINAKGDIRKRIEVRSGLDAPRLAWLANVMTPCPHCGVLYHPMRPRKGDSDKVSYYAVSCQAEGCSKGNAAAAEQKAIIADLEGNPVYAPMPLFD
jgi:hypothetical protein